MRVLLWVFALIGLVGMASPALAAHPGESAEVTYVPDVTFTLRTDIASGKLVSPCPAR